MTSTNGQPLTITFESLDLEMKGNCADYGNCTDYIEIHTWLHNIPSIQRYFGSSLPEPITGTNISVRFRTDDIGTGLGFFASICCSVRVEHGHLIASPNYPSFYPREVHQVYPCRYKNSFVPTPLYCNSQLSLYCNSQFRSGSWIQQMDNLSQ